MTDRLAFIQQKVVSPEKAKTLTLQWRLKNNRIVFTNGCFDILHEGHITYLARAASLGNKLIIGLNSDLSVKQQGKGDDRPVNKEGSRALVLAALGFVDLVLLFDGTTPLDLIEQLKPDLLVKGADYDPFETNPSSKSYIVGSDFVKSYGGEVAAIPLVEGFSTTLLLKKLKG